MRTRFRWLAGLTMVGCFAVPAPAAAQWHFGISMGVNFTRPASVDIESPAQDLSLVFHNVHFSARPFASPQYYGWRLGRMLGSTHRLGVEFEFIHEKVISDAARTYVVSPGAAGGEVIASLVRMDTLVQRYDMTHGLNFLLVNLLARAALKGDPRHPIVLTLRGGGGVVIPHAETTVLGESAEHYEFAGAAAAGAIGLEYRIAGRFTVFGEYKLTFARPQITLAHGTGQMTAITQHVVGGVLLRLSRR